MAERTEYAASIVALYHNRGEVNMTNLDVGQRMSGARQPGDKPIRAEAIDKLAREVGIVERGWVRSDQACSDLAYPAVKRALEMWGKDKNTIRAIEVATNLGDHLGSSTAVILQQMLDLPEAIAGADISAGCPAFIHALRLTFGDVESEHGLGGPQICVASETCSKGIDPRDRTTYPLFGDGAGAVIVERVELKPGQAKPQFVHITKGQFLKSLYVPGGAGRDVNGKRSIVMDGKVVAEQAITSMYQACNEVLEKAGAKLSDIDLLIPHQANINIIYELGKKLGFPVERTVINIDRYGNTSAASIPVAMSEAYQTNRLKRGHIVLAPTFGAGLNAAVAYLPMDNLPQQESVDRWP